VQCTGTENESQHTAYGTRQINGKKLSSKFGEKMFLVIFS
jgi:hypothetical protein